MAFARPNYMYAPQSFGKRKSLRDQLDRISTLDEEERYAQRYQKIDELERDVVASKSFRWHAPASQARQDHHLELYKTFVCVMLKGLSPDQVEATQEDDMLRLLFPEDFNVLAHQYSLFITYAFKQAAPRSRAADTIQVRTLCQYRDSLLFWGSWHYKKRGVAFPAARMFNEMVQSMRYVASVHGSPMLRQEKPWLGLAELRQLLDHEAITNRCIELSEEHQLLWCIGRVTALRPGSLCPSGRYARTEPLKWRSLVFTRGDEPGQWHCRLMLDHIDIKRKQDRVTAPDEVSNQPVVLNLTSPEPQNLVFSPAHRLLVIALRRRLLKNIATLDDLFNSPFHEIRVAQEYLDDTVFLAGTPKGTALDYKRPMTATAMTEYLRRRGNQLGYTMGLTWYAIRRRAATDMARRIGLSATRIFLGHTPDSQTLERYYLNVTETLDASGVLTDQRIEPGGHSSKQSSTFAPLALGKLDEVAVQRTRGQALSQLTRRLILADPEGPEDETPLGLKNYRRRVRQFASQQLIQQEKEFQRGVMTHEAMKERKAGLEASKFADEVLQRALDAMQSRPTGQWPSTGDEASTETSLEDPNDEEGMLFIGGADDGAQFERAEEDLEKTLSDNLDKDVEFDEDGALTLTIDSEVDGEDPRSKKLQELPYENLARSAMQLLLDNSMSKYENWSQKDKTCPVCKDDDTVSPEQAAHEYGNADKLDAHVTGNFHHPMKRWRRRAIRDMATGRDGRFQCPYCLQCEPDEPVRSYPRVSDLMKHVFESSDLTTSKRHDELKAMDGWYDEDFETLNLGATQRSLEKHVGRGAKSLADLGIDITPHRQLMATEPYEHSTSIVRGSHPSAPLPARYLPFVESGQVEYRNAADAIPAHLQSFITTGFPETPTNPLPSYMRADVTVTQHARSQEEDFEMDG